MKITMIGSGAAGSVFAAYLKKGGASLYLVDRYKAHMDKIAADGLVFSSPEGEEVLTGFVTASSAESIGVMDVVILMVKATQTESIMPTLTSCNVCKAVVGVDLWPEMLEELPRLKQGFATYYPSMAQDVLIHQRQTEIALLNGAIVKYGMEYGVATPVNEALTRMITCIQANYDKQFVK